MRTLLRLAAVVLVIAGLVATAAAVWLFTNGISARAEPSALERTVARRLRSWMIPRSDWNRPNPVPRTPEAIDAGLRHFADHCASCHANDGSGEVELGRSLYPRSPDLRAAETQDLSDGALFYIIEEGVRLTGMPGWKTGTTEGERESWRLVHFIRHLPQLTGAERRRMETMNPRTLDEWREDQEVERFLQGGAGGDGGGNHAGGHP